MRPGQLLGMHLPQRGSTRPVADPRGSVSLTTSAFCLGVAGSYKDDSSCNFRCQSFKRLSDFFLIF